MPLLHDENCSEMMICTAAEHHHHLVVLLHLMLASSPPPPSTTYHSHIHSISLSVTHANAAGGGLRGHRGRSRGRRGRPRARKRLLQRPLLKRRHSISGLRRYETSLALKQCPKKPLLLLILSRKKEPHHHAMLLRTTTERKTTIRTDYNKECERCRGNAFAQGEMSRTKIPLPQKQQPPRRQPNRNGKAAVTP